MTGPAGWTGVAATVTTFDDGRQQFTTYFPCAAFAADCLLVAHMYYTWGLHGMIPGFRKALFNTQVCPPRPRACASNTRVHLTS